MKTLVLYASPLTKSKPGSISQKATKKFLELYKVNNFNKEIIELDLNEKKCLTKSLDSFSFKDGSFFSDGLTDEILSQLKNVDHLIISTSMINFNVPAVLKNLIDRIAVANKTFKYKYDGNGKSEGLIKHITVQIIATQGAPKGWYPFGDHVTYLEGVFNFLGMKVQESILIAGTKTKEWSASSIEKNISKYNELFKKQSNFK